MTHDPVNHPDHCTAHPSGETWKPLAKIKAGDIVRLENGELVEVANVTRNCPYQGYFTAGAIYVTGQKGVKIVFWHPAEFRIKVENPDLHPTKPDYDPVNHPAHYTAHPSGVECITVTEHMNFNVGNAVKYLWRSGAKGDALEDLKKAAWYVNREIERIGKAAK